MKGDKEIVGTLRGFDDYVNMVLEGLATQLADQHKNCDFMMKNFEALRASSMKDHGDPREG